MKILRNILWGFIILDVVSVIMFILPPGRAYYMPEFLAEITMIFFAYAIFALQPVSILGAVVTVALMIYRKVKKYPLEKNHICLLVLYLLNIPLGWLLFNAAMSV